MAKESEEVNTSECLQDEDSADGKEDATFNVGQACLPCTISHSKKRSLLLTSVTVGF